ncbi:MAG: hypothetical protein LBT53_01960 [Puniceicoccales bacterium]|nr:hypothetical protein [Puniceicoccales bacterium]
MVPFRANLVADVAVMKKKSGKPAAHAGTETPSPQPAAVASPAPALERRDA